MRKDFQHREKWFRVWESKDPDWFGSGYVLHTPNQIIPTVKVHYYYVKEEDKLYWISKESLLENRAQYNGKWHIDRDFLVEVTISDEWRKEIDEYEKQLVSKGFYEQRG